MLDHVFKHRNVKGYCFSILCLDVKEVNELSTDELNKETEKLASAWGLTDDGLKGMCRCALYSMLYLHPLHSHGHGTR